jgi:RHS repeat-associated protein
MQLASSARIPDGILAAMPLGGQKPHQGLPSRNPALYQGPSVCNSTTALGLQAAAVLNRIGSCSTGKERDTESGNDYFGARYYASSMGRFMSPDPLPWIHWQRGNEDDQNMFEGFIANPQNFNLYAYVNNNPLNHTDPTGMNACGTKDDSSCKVTVTIRDRSKDSSGHYNDQYSGLKGNGAYNATATVTVNGKVTGIFLASTVPSGPGYATIQDGTYNGTLTYHDGHPSIALNGGGPVPVVGDRDPATGKSYATGALTHIAGNQVPRSPLGLTGMTLDGRPVSAGCQLICTAQYGDFERATGMNPSSGPPQQHFTVDLWTSENPSRIYQDLQMLAGRAGPP